MAKCGHNARRLWVSIKPSVNGLLVACWGPVESYWTRVGSAVKELREWGGAASAQ